MKVCLMLEGQEGIEWDQWLALALAAESAGLDGLFRSDHYQSFLRGDPAGSLDAWTTLAALAARTERIRLGTLVSPVTFRHVSVLSKAVVTVDQISAGRAELGVGAGWFEPEHATYCFPMPPPRDRFDELDRQLAELHRQWADDSDVWPKPVQRPRPPIIVGGRAKPRSLQAAARFADEYNTIMPSLEEARDRVRLVAEAAMAFEREPLVFSMLAGCVVGHASSDFRQRLRAWREFTGRDDEPLLAGTVEQVCESLRDYASAGVDRVMLQHLVHEDIEMVALLGEIAAALAA
jgi:alkanesulfonate monooxygenase SsuD/methylene tetrahydromethanopterin reductase-like flavin-dependent oxidoreductase (luciferase family)